MTPDTFGPTSETPLAQFDPVLHCWKMSQAICLWGEQPLLVNLPKSGMTVNGNLYQRPALAPPIDAKGCSLWPTPTARDGKGASGHKKLSRRMADLTYRARIVDGVTTGSLNPTWVEYLMGFPEGWTDLEA